MRIVVLCTLGAVTLTASAFGVVSYPSVWEASSGLTPDQVGYDLFNSSVPETPVLSPTMLTLANDSAPETMYYRMGEPDLLFPGTIEISFRMRYVSGVSSYIGRSPAVVAVTTAPAVGASLYIVSDGIFLNSGSIYSRGPQNTSIDTDSSFHDYLLRIVGTGPGSAVSVFQDGNLVLSGASFSDSSDHGLTQRIAFGEATVHAYGVSEWESFSHNAAVIPEPTTVALLGLGSLALVMVRREK